ncbi:MAG: restriction endonuclease subunit S, partial [Planctomycetaceae bacterium]|nr:restriction endonuclease subunit S [Planctomycetaceae bacterium]
MTHYASKVVSAPLVSLVSITGGGTPSKQVPEYYTGNIPWVTPKDMKSWLIDDAEDHITEEAITSSSTTLIDPNAVLVCIRSGVLAHTLPVAINRVPVTLNQDMKAFRCSEQLHPSYLARFLKWYSPRLLQTVRGTTAHNLSMDVVKQIEIPLPPLSEQKRIADILDKADAIRRKRQEAIGSFDDLSDSLFSQVARVADVEPRSISDLLESEVLIVHKDGNYGGSYPRKHEFGAVGIPFLSAKHV